MDVAIWNIKVKMNNLNSSPHMKHLLTLIEWKLFKMNKICITQLKIN